IPSVYVDATDRIVEYGLNVTLNCNVTSFPIHSYVYWQRISNGTTTNITSSQAGIHGVSNMLPSLTILMIKSADSGLYTCFALNIVGTGYSDVVNLTVIGDIPHVAVGPTIRRVEYGCNVTLDSNVTSFPLHVSIYWQRISNGTTTNITTSSSTTPHDTSLHSALTILKADFTDSGLYTCYAVNIVGTAKSDPVDLIVLGGIPTVEVTSGTVDILYGHNHTMFCKIVSVYELTTVYWQKMFNGTIENITSDNHGIAGATISRPSLTIVKANPSHSGQYACCAVNIAGTGQSNFINVTVFGEENYPIVDIDFNQLIVHYGDSFTIESSVQTNSEFR
ncbi:Hypothetical predicted protein, partial [Mytilus galloprovincialis]